MAEPIILPIKVEKPNFSKAEDDIRGFQRRIQSQTAIDLSARVWELREDLRRANKQIQEYRKQGNQQAVLNLRARTELLRKDLTQANRQLNNFLRTGNQRVSVLGRLFDNVGFSISGIATQLGIIGGVGAIAGLTRQMFTLASATEQARVSFETLTGSADTANQLLRDIDTFAATTPFNRLELIKNTQRLLGFGFAAEEVLGNLESIGDAVSAVGWGTAELNWVVLALGQIEAKGKVSAEELLQLAERWLPVFDILQEKLNLTQEEIGNIGKAGITAEEGIRALLEWFDERFAGSLEKQSQTLQGQFSNLVDNTEILLGRLGEKFSWFFSGVIAVASRSVNDISRLFWFIEEDTSDFWQVIIDRIRILQWEIDTLTDSYNNGSITIKEYSEQKRALEDTVDSLNGSLETEQKRFDDLNDAIATQESIIISSRQQIQRYQDRIDWLTEWSFLYEQRLKTAQIEQWRFVERLNDAQAELERLNNTVNIGASDAETFGEVFLDASNQIQQLSTKKTRDEFVALRNEIRKTLSILATTTAEAFRQWLISTDEATTRLNNIKNAIGELNSANEPLEKVSETTNKTSRWFRRVTRAVKETKEATDDWAKLVTDSENRSEKLQQSAESAFDDIGGSIEDSLEKVRDFSTEIQNIDQELQWLDDQAAVWIAGRAIEIASEIDEVSDKLKDTNNELSQLLLWASDPEQRQELISEAERLSQELVRLKEEEELAKANVSEQALKDANEEALKSETELLIDAREARRKELEEEKLALQNSKDEELEVLRNFYSQAEDAWREFAVRFDESLRIPEARLERIAALANQIRAANVSPSSTVPGGSSSTTNNINNSTTSITVNQSPNDSTPADTVANQIANLNSP